MASNAKKFYWKKILPEARVKLSEDPLIYLEVEDLGRDPKEGHVGYAVVDEVTNKLAEPFDGEYGLSKGTKEEYESLKKKNQSNPSAPLWREEIKADGLHRSKTVVENVAGVKEPASAVIEGQSKEKTLPEDSKPKVGKRKAATKTED